MSSRAERQHAPLIRFNHGLLYRVRDNVTFSVESDRQRAFFLAVTEFKARYDCELIPGDVLKNIWANVADAQGYDEDSYDVISRCLADSMIVCA